MKKFLHVLNHFVLISTFTDWDDVREIVTCDLDDENDESNEEAETIDSYRSRYHQGLFETNVHVSL